MINIVIYHDPISAENQLKTNLQSGTMLFCDGWRRCFKLLILFSTAKSSKTAENHSMINELETTACLASKWQ